MVTTSSEQVFDLYYMLIWWIWGGEAFEDEENGVIDGLSVAYHDENKHALTKSNKCRHFPTSMIMLRIILKENNIPNNDINYNQTIDVKCNISRKHFLLLYRFFHLTQVFKGCIEHFE